MLMEGWNRAGAVLSTRTVILRIESAAPRATSASAMGKVARFAADVGVTLVAAPPAAGSTVADTISYADSTGPESRTVQSYALAVDPAATPKRTEMTMLSPTATEAVLSDTSVTSSSGATTSTSCTDRWYSSGLSDTGLGSESPTLVSQLCRVHRAWQ